MTVPLLYLLSVKPYIRYWEGRGRYNDVQELVQSLKKKKPDDPMKEVDQHVYNTRKWLFGFFLISKHFTKT